jgi:hypothetical protein
MAAPSLTKEQIDAILLPTFTSAEQMVHFQEMQRLISIIQKTDTSIELYKMANESLENDPYIASKLDLREEFVSKLTMLLSDFNIHVQPIPKDKNQAHFIEPPLKITQAA